MNNDTKTLHDRPADAAPLVEGKDFYFEDGLMVLTRSFLLDRGYCCESGCRHCPYGYAERQALK